ncbi:zinc finger, CCHC-type containing protein [Tanacetum coccineum]
MDVKTTFLNGDLEEEVYMKQPEGFVMPGNEHKVCKLVKSLYGLKQAPKQWHQKFDEVVLSSGFLLNQSDKCVYSKFDSSGAKTKRTTYVNMKFCHFKKLGLGFLGQGCCAPLWSQGAEPLAGFNQL